MGTSDPLLSTRARLAPLIGRCICTGNGDISIALGGSAMVPDFDRATQILRIHRCGYVSECKKHGCLAPATLICEKVDGAGRHVRQIELCDRHGEVVIE